VVLVVTATASAQEKLTADKLPAKVAAAVKGRFPGAEFTSITKEKEGNDIVYDIELKQQGRKYEMDIKEDGTIIEIEKQVFNKDVPAAITKAVTAKYPGSTIEEVMEVNKVNGKVETPDHYEVTLVTADKKKLEVEVSLDGKTVKAGAEGEKK
jgi:uncharacterized membrane protein YkoI